MRREPKGLGFDPEEVHELDTSPGLFLARTTAATTLLGLLPKTANPWAWHVSRRNDLLDLFGRRGAGQLIFQASNPTIESQCSLRKECEKALELPEIASP